MGKLRSGRPASRHVQRTDLEHTGSAANSRLKRGQVTHEQAVQDRAVRQEDLDKQLKGEYSLLSPL